MISSGLLNFANTYNEVKDVINLAPTEVDYLALFFTKDGHIITHGKDFLPTFTPNVRGLVPTSDGNKKKVFRADGTWAIITTADLPIAPNIPNGGNTTIVTAEQVYNYVNEAFVAQDAMRYKGTIEFDGTNYKTQTADGIINSFPLKCEIGDTYRITKVGRYAGMQCESGDLLICVKDGTGTGNALNDIQYWTSVQANINGETVHSVNGNKIYTYTSKLDSVFNIYAPDSSGVSGQLLVSSGANVAPRWANTGDITVGTAIKTSKSLSAGAGLSFGVSGAKFDGSVDRTLSLLPATRTTIGGVIINQGDAKETISVTTTGSIYLTKQNIINALGYTPGDVADNSSYTLVVTNSATGSSNVASSNPFINLIQSQHGTNTAVGSFQIIGDSGLTVAGNTTVKLTLKEATSTYYGSIKVGYSPATNREYALLLKDGKAYVNVPWIKEELATATKDGLVPMWDKTAGNLVSGSWVLSKLPNGTYDWTLMPETAFSDTFRDITIGGASIGKDTLNFVPTGDVFLKTDSKADGIQDISFGLSWWNISTNKYETV